MEHDVISRLRTSMRAEGLDALVALSTDNVTYTAGFLVPSHALNRFRRTITIIAGEDFAAQIVVNVEEALAQERSRFKRLRAYNQFTEDPADVLADLLAEAGVSQGRIAIELDYMPAQDYIRLVERLPQARFEECRDFYAKARMLKTDDEIERVRQVGVLTEQVMAEVLGMVQPGMSEKDVGRRIVDLTLKAGADSVIYQVGSGERSGITNCKPTTKVIERDDVIRIEILAEQDNYRSNVTRTAVLGAPTSEQKDIWAVLIGARDKCRAMLRPGTGVPELYQTYVDACRGGGIEPTLKFLGHGIGVSIHEEPYLTDTRRFALAANMTHTMEPLYMMPGRMGFHVEDMYVITGDGHERLTGDIVPNDQLIAL